MSLALAFRLGWRNLWRHPRRTLLTALAFSLGVFLLIISLGLGDGMHEKMIETGVRVGSGHVVIEPADARSTVDELHYLSAATASAAERVLSQADLRDMVRGVAPRLLASGLLSSANNSTGVQVVGAVPDRERGVTLLPEKIVEGTFLEETGRTPSTVIGSALANKLGVGLGSKVVLMTQAGSEIQSQLLRVRGIFSTGMEDVDLRLVSMRIEDLQLAIQKDGAVSHLAIFLDGSERTEEVRRLVAQRIERGFDGDPPSVLSWQEAMPELAQFIVIDDAGNYLFNGVLLFMVALGVLNTILMAVLERRREFSLLLAIGMRPFEIAAMVMAESFLLTGVGTVVGLVLGWSLHAYWAANGLDFSGAMDQGLSVAGVSVDPIVYSYLYPGRIRWTLIFVAILGFAASLYPAVRAARTAPSEATQG